MKDVGKFYGQSVYFTTVCYILWPFGVFYGYIFGINFPVLVFCTKEKSGNPAGRLVLRTGKLSVTPQLVHKKPKP
jgi:hypothetical protein